MTRWPQPQAHLFDAFDEAEPIKRKTPRDGFRWCDPCHGTGHVGPEMCRSCMGLGQVLL